MSGFLQQDGGYRKLRVFQIAEIICDLTVVFVKRFIPAKSRTCDQMEQAARSGKQSNSTTPANPIANNSESVRQVRQVGPV